MRNFWKFELVTVHGISNVVVLTQIEENQAFDTVSKNNGSIEYWNTRMNDKVQNVIVSVEYTNGQIAKILTAAISKINHDSDVVFVSDFKSDIECCCLQLKGFFNEDPHTASPLFIGTGELFQNKTNARKYVGSAF